MHGRVILEKLVFFIVVDHVKYRTNDRDSYATTT